jgi:hypothetical protein
VSTPRAALATDDRSVTAREPGFSHSVSVAAVADLDGDGRADWLVRHADEAGTGNYRAYDLLVVTNVAPPGLLTAKEVAASLCPR